MRWIQMASIDGEREIIGIRSAGAKVTRGRSRRRDWFILQSNHMSDVVSTRSSDTPETDEGVMVERLHDDVVLPARATAGSAGYDLRAYLRHRRVRCSDGVAQREQLADERDGEWGVVLEPREMALIPLGFRTRLPDTVEAQIRPRSGQSFKHALTIPNAPGTVDSDYAEEWMVIVRNDAPVPRRIVHGERIAQVVFARYVALELRESDVARSSERAGGFGSTGQH
jgi:dUTP pyrophosphatase